MHDKCGGQKVYVHVMLLTSSRWVDTAADHAKARAKQMNMRLKIIFGHPHSVLSVSSAICYWRSRLFLEGRAERGQRGGLWCGGQTMIEINNEIRLKIMNEKRLDSTTFCLGRERAVAMPKFT